MVVYFWGVFLGCIRINFALEYEVQLRKMDVEENLVHKEKLTLKWTLWTWNFARKWRLLRFGLYLPYEGSAGAIWEAPCIPMLHNKKSDPETTHGRHSRSRLRQAWDHRKPQTPSRSMFVAFNDTTSLLWVCLNIYNSRPLSKLTLPILFYTHIKHAHARYSAC